MSVLTLVSGLMPSWAIELLLVLGALWAVSYLWSLLITIYTYFFRPSVNLKKYGKWTTKNSLTATVVTGCTDGIGKAVAEEFARKGLNVVLISRTQSKLDEQAKELSSSYQIETKTIAIDFASEDMAIYEKIKAVVQNLDVGILVNNVGTAYDHAEYFHLLDKKKIDSLIKLNVVATTYMSYLVLPGMVDRKRGAIINVSSASGVLDEPLYALYSGTKAFVNSFSRALHYEYKEKGVHVQSQLPAFVTTKLSKLRTASFFISTPKAYARKFIAQIGHDPVIVSHWTHALQIEGVALKVPEWLKNAFLLSRGKDIRQRAYKKKQEKQQ